MKPSESNHKFCLGIDISKADYHVAIQCVETGKVIARSKFANTAEGHSKLHQWLVANTSPDLPVHACMEATGSYGETLADSLHGKVAKLSVVNPRAIKAHGDSDLRRCKSDPADARLIADFCMVKKPVEWTPPSPQKRAIKAISRHISCLKKRHHPRSKPLGNHFRQDRFQESQSPHHLDGKTDRKAGERTR
jgi:transposase